MICGQPADDVQFRRLLYALYGGTHQRRGEEQNAVDKSEFHLPLSYHSMLDRVEYSTRCGPMEETAYIPSPVSVTAHYLRSPPDSQSECE